MLNGTGDAENRVGDGHFLQCETSTGQRGYTQLDNTGAEGECKPVEEICPNIWGTVASTNLDRDKKFDEWCGPDKRETRLGCCGGFQETLKPMRDFEHELSNKKKTVCWTEKGLIPTGLDNTDVKKFNGHAALHVENFQSTATYTAGQEIELTWVATAQHGGSIEVGIVEDKFETSQGHRYSRTQNLEINFNISNPNNT
jgi:hypothetical protein